MRNKFFTTLMVTVMMAATLTACGTEMTITGENQQTATVKTEAQEVVTASYSEEEINAAKGIVYATFEANFKDCELIDLYYDETFSGESSESLAEQYGVKEVMILLSTFTVPENCENFALNAGTTYEGYNWVFTRKAGEEWVLQTWGY